MKSPRYLERRQVEALLRECRRRAGPQAKRDWFLFYFLSQTGLRISEALALKVEDLVLTARPAFVRVKTLKKRKPAPGWDDVLLTPSTVRHARLYIEHQLVRPACGLERFLFPRRWRKVWPADVSMTRRNASKLFREYARRAGLPPTATLHSLRHYRGTVLYHTTKDLEFTREQLRHSDLESTKEYLHNSPGRVRGYMAQLDGPGDEEE